jgi:hypothetical protein
MSLITKFNFYFENTNVEPKWWWYKMSLDPFILIMSKMNPVNKFMWGHIDLVQVHSLWQGKYIPKPKTI